MSIHHKIIQFRNTSIRYKVCHQRNYSQLTTKQVKLPINEMKQELQSKFSNVNLANPPKQFTILCVVTGATIAGSSLIFLREKLLFGTIGGVTAKTITAPLERLTVFRQASVDFKSSILLIINTIFKEEGLKGFWRGNGYVLCSCFTLFITPSNTGIQNIYI